VLLAAQHRPHGRIIVDTDWVPTPGGEAQVATEATDAIAGIVMPVNKVSADWLPIHPHAAKATIALPSRTGSVPDQILAVHRQALR
jgi:hypothetical protein